MATRKKAAARKPAPPVKSAKGDPTPSSKPPKRKPLTPAQVEYKKVYPDTVYPEEK